MIIAMLFAAQVAVAPLNYSQAKARADASEAAMAPALYATLLARQDKALHEAVGACKEAHPDYYRFTVVLSLRADGSVAGSWLQGRTTLARCVHAQLATQGLPGHWPRPFYTSFEVSFDNH